MQDEYAQEELGGDVATPCIEDLVGKAAESKSDSDVEKLFNGLKGRELFLKTKEDNKDEIPIVKVNGSLSVFVLYTSEDDERLTTIYGGTPWESALNMLLHMSAVDGLMVQSSTTNAYVCVTKEKARALFLVAQRRSLSVSY